MDLKISEAIADRYEIISIHPKCWKYKDKSFLVGLTGTIMHIRQAPFMPDKYYMFDFYPDIEYHLQVGEWIQFFGAKIKKL